MESTDIVLSPSVVMRVGPENIRSIILSKEKELHDINAYRICTLETLLRDKERAAKTAEERLWKLQEDSDYNLKLLEGRDEELARIHAQCDLLKNSLKDRKTEVSESREREVKSQAELQIAEERGQELQLLYQEKLRDAHIQVTTCKLDGDDDDDLRSQHEDVLETQRRNFEQKLREKDDEMERQRRELTVTFDNVMRQRETELKRESEELRTKVREVELKNKALIENTDAQCARVEEVMTKNEKMQQVMDENDKKMKVLEWTVADVKAAKETKVEELENKVAKLVEVKQQLLVDHESKTADVSQLLNSVQNAFVQQKTQHDEILQCLLERKKSGMQEADTRSEAKLIMLDEHLREKVEVLQTELKHVKRDADDKLKDMECEVKRVQSALQELEGEKFRNCTGDHEAQPLHKRLQESARQIALLRERNDCLFREKEAVEERMFCAENEVQRLRSELLLSRKASALVTTSFDSQHVAAAASSATRISLESVAAAPSRLCSDASGTLCPLPHVSPHRTKVSLLRPKAIAARSANAIETKNAKLRELIQHMKQSLIQQAEELEALPRRAGGSQSTFTPNVDLLEAEEGCVAVATQDKSSGPDSSISLQHESCKRELAEAKQSVKRKSKQIVELESYIREIERVRETESQWQSRHAAVEAQLTDLNRKLSDANCDIDRLVRDRSQLMELSNQLRADLQRNTNDAGARWPTVCVDFAGKKDYDNLIAVLTQSLEESQSYNKTLRKELHRMITLQVQLHRERESSSIGLQTNPTQRNRRRRGHTKDALAEKF
ncbi:unnamed protein product [Peronospora belbahrii]|uniref:Uncharacterized protein n=1 Tax=Peronospora belbahrii TaxID=622444 RepID=A0ABN8DAA3_9STRA|nr:unnamed protein product [Peronospora belbahrii]